MAIIDDVSNQMKDAMRARDSARLTALRGIRATFITEMKEDGSDTLSDDRAIAALRRLARQRQDSVDAYGAAGRADLADIERAELALINTFLPQLADEATTRAYVQVAIAETGAADARGVGKVMGAVMRSHKGEVDGALVRSIAAELLGA